MTGGSRDEGSRWTARMATPFTWILRLPRIGPVVTFNSVLAGASPMVRLLFLRRCQPDQVRWVVAVSHLSTARAVPQGRVGLRTQARAAPASPELTSS